MSDQICASSDVVEKGSGFVYRVEKDGQIWSAFVIRFNGEALAYLNACAHVGLRLNGDSNEFFDRDLKLLLCMSHGAAYVPDSGVCVRGPCKGLGLIPLKILEQDASIYYEDETYKLVHD